jgi:hypothetical protein
MSLNVQLHGPLWCVYHDGEEVFSGDYRDVEEWLDHAEISPKYPAPPAGTEPLITHVGRLPSLNRLRNAPVTSAKP